MSLVTTPPPARAERVARVPLTNTRERYGRVAQVFHWTIALLFLAQYPGGIVMEELPNTPEWIDIKVWLYSAHKTSGIVIFALALARVSWALLNPHPRLLNAERKLEARAAATIHWTLYTAILLVPLSGMAIHWTTTGYAPVWLPFPEHIGLPVTDRAAGIATMVHKALTITVLVAIALHIGGALKHHFIDRDATLRRMLPWDAPALPTLPPPSMQPRFGPTFLIGASALALVATGALAAGAILTDATVERSEETLAEVAATPSEAAPEVDAESVIGAPQRWIVVPEASRLAITVNQLGSPVEGSFEAFDADILFDPNDLAASRVEVAIELPSLTLGSVTDQAKGLLGSTEAPQASFVASEFEAAEDGSFVAKGTLALAGAEAPVTLPFDLTIDEDRASMTGQATLERLDWGIGASEYPDGGSLGLDVTVDVAIEAVRDGA